jgi:hypothetical protein
MATSTEESKWAEKQTGAGTIFGLTPLGEREFPSASATIKAGILGSLGMTLWRYAPMDSTKRSTLDW